MPFCNANIQIGREGNIDVLVKKNKSTIDEHNAWSGRQRGIYVYLPIARVGEPLTILSKAPTRISCSVCLLYIEGRL